MTSVQSGELVSLCTIKHTRVHSVWGDSSAESMQWTVAPVPEVRDSLRL